MIKIRLSGGPNGQKFKGFSNKKEVEQYITKSFENQFFEFVQGAKHAKYIIVPNEVPFASKSASLTGGQQLTLNEFVIIMKKRSSQKVKKVSKKTSKQNPKKASKKASKPKKSSKKSLKKASKPKKSSKKSSKKSFKKASKPKKSRKLRPSPSVSATQHNWEIRTGNDGNLWQSKPNKNDVFSWRRV